MSWSTVITIAALGLAAAVVLLGAWWLWWRLPKRQVDRLRLTIRDPKARADVEDNFRKTIGQPLGGAAVLIGAALAYVQFSQQQQTSQRQFSEQQQRSQQQFSEQQRASRDLLISNQVSKGFEQLGSDKIVIRLAGIYALEGVMNGSEQYHQPVLEALSAFVRDGTRTETGNGPPATDIQAALTVIGRRAAIKTGVPGASAPNFANAHIPKAELSRANLIKANLRGANLSGADLTVAYLIKAHLHVANLSGTELTVAYLNVADQHLADLDVANLSGATVSRADLRGTFITQAQLDQACGTNVKLDPGLTLKPCP
jgi:uncharacterized protein YjbI with pentapeptide repeats